MTAQKGLTYIEVGLEFIETHLRVPPLPCSKPFSSCLRFESSDLKEFGGYSGLHVPPIKVNIIKFPLCDGNLRFLLGFPRR